MHFFKNFISRYLIVVCFFCLLFNVAQAALLDADSFSSMADQEEAFANTAGFDINATVGGITAVVINGFLGLLGIIFLVLIITAGYKWMMAQGNEEKVTEAKDTMYRAVIGLIIVVSAYAISYFVFNALEGVEGGGGGLMTSP